MSKNKSIKKTNKKVNKKTESKTEKRIPSKGMKSLLNSELVSEKLAGVLKMFGRIELLKDKSANKNTVSGKVSKAGIAIRLMSEEELKNNESIKKAVPVIVNNFSTLKDALTDPKIEITKELQGVYDILVSFGKAEKTDGIPEGITLF